MALTALNALNRGEVSTFEGLLTPSSRAWFRGVSTIHDSALTRVSVEVKNPIQIISVRLVPDGLQEMDVDQKVVTRDLAILQVDIGTETFPLTLVRRQEGWRVDLYSLAEVWSHAAERALPPL